MGRFPVLAGVDLDVARGEVVLLQGANGAGKTSLLRVCAGLLPVVSGTASVLGCDLVVDRRAARRHTGLYGHATALYDDLTVLDNVRFAVRAAKAPLVGVDPALERLGLTGRLRTAPVASLSAGQRRRTALAILVARAPQLWLLDEPHAGLDAEHRDLLDTLVRQAADAGATVVLASHEADRAQAIADRIVTVAGGMASSSVVPQEVQPTIPTPQVQPLRVDARSRSAQPGGEAVAEGRPSRGDCAAPAREQAPAHVV